MHVALDHWIIVILDVMAQDLDYGYVGMYNYF